MWLWSKSKSNMAIISNNFGSKIDSSFIETEWEMRLPSKNWIPEWIRNEQKKFCTKTIRTNRVIEKMEKLKRNYRHRLGKVGWEEKIGVKFLILSILSTINSTDQNNSRDYNCRSLIDVLEEFSINFETNSIYFGRMMIVRTLANMIANTKPKEKQTK